MYLTKINQKNCTNNNGTIIFHLKTLVKKRDVDFQKLIEETQKLSSPYTVSIIMRIYIKTYLNLKKKIGRLYLGRRSDKFLKKL